jgi:site-specific recombinase XerD
MLRAGCGIREVQAFLGHKSIETTQVYTHIVKEDLKKIINIYHPRGGYV